MYNISGSLDMTTVYIRKIGVFKSKKEMKLTGFSKKNGFSCKIQINSLFEEIADANVVINRISLIFNSVPHDILTN